jgi:hypothetical protein
MCVRYVAPFPDMIDSVRTLTVIDVTSESEELKPPSTWTGFAHPTHIVKEILRICELYAS